MKKISTLFLIISIVVGASSCSKDVINGSGPVITQDRDVAEFTEIDLYINATIHYTQEDTTMLEIRAQQNIADAIITEVIDDKLIVRVPDGTNFKSFSPIHIYVSSPMVNTYFLPGNGAIETAGSITLDNADLFISGSGNISFAGIESNDIDARISGSGSILIKDGSCDNTETTISGSGNINLTAVESTNVKAFISGSGETRVYATEKLDAVISGSGSVYYTGNPAVTSQITGSGKLIRL